MEYPSKKINTSAFVDAYDLLNAEQKKAVDSIYGPVLVVAGPGTGKTQLLAVRVCNILMQTDLQASNILCLTYTDAGCTAMRNRLISFMGADAYKVGIFTYHAFCNLIIRENPEYFDDFRELSNASDLELMETLTELIDELPLDHPLKRLAGDIYYDRQRFKTLFSVMKREGWTAEYITNKIEEYEDQLKEDPEYQYKIGLKKGQPKPDVKKMIDRFDFIKEGSKLLERYNTLLLKRERIDFDDSILWVLNKLKSEPELLLKYQERFQFVLADEYQDTNGSQNELLFTLVNNEYDDRPNLFVVGDDDQSIYRFQGANMDNIVLFKETYKPEVIVLQNNYRSHQGILDKAMLLINNNKERLSYQFKEFSKNLKESRRTNEEGSEPIFMPYANDTNQQCGVVKKIKELVAQGVPHNDIAIIYKKHIEAEKLLKYFTLEGVPISIRKKINILKLNETKRILALLRYIHGEHKDLNSKNAELFEILHYDFWGLESKDIAKISFVASQNTDEYADDLIWREAISNEDILKKIGVNNPSLFVHVSTVIEGLINDYSNVTAQVLFEKVITNTALLNHILASQDKVWRLQVVNTLFEFIKSETSKGEEVGIGTILELLDKMEEMEIEMPISYLKSNNDGINFITAHGSKGLEFGHVFILNADDKSWLNHMANKVKFPPNMLFGAGDVTEEDDRRLFYVAITRARNNAYITFARRDEKDKEREAVRFLSEMGYDVLIPSLENDEEDISEFTSALLRYEQGKVQLIENHLIDKVLETMHMNATGITKYLKCPRTFYFENILRVPMARTKNLGFGNAVHYSLEMFYRKFQKDPEQNIPSKEFLLDIFKKGMKKFHSHFTKQDSTYLIHYGSEVLTFYYNNTILSWVKPREIKTEYKIKGHIGDIPVSGIIDRLDFYDGMLKIFDYKTGNRNGSSEKFKKGTDLTDGGDYWRQGVFYQILVKVDNANAPKINGVVFELLEQYEENKSVDKSIAPDNEEIDLVTQQLEYVYEKIKNHEFDEGCNEETCKWCTFVKNNMNIVIPSDGVEDSEADEMGLE